MVIVNYHNTLDLLNPLRSSFSPLIKVLKIMFTHIVRSYVYNFVSLGFLIYSVILKTHKLLHYIGSLNCILLKFEFFGIRNFGFKLQEIKYNLDGSPRLFIVYTLLYYTIFLLDL